MRYVLLRCLLLRRRGHPRRFRGDLVARRRDKRVYRSRAEVARRPAAHRYRALRRFAVPGDEHVGDLLQLSLTDLIANLLLAIVELDAKPAGSNSVANPRRILLVTVVDRQHNRLDGRKPDRELASVGLDQN